MIKNVSDEEYVKSFVLAISALNSHSYIQIHLLYFNVIYMWWCVLCLISSSFKHVLNPLETGNYINIRMKQRQNTH